MNHKNINWNINKNVNILIVEDSPANLNVLERFIGKVSEVIEVNIFSSRNGKDALDQLANTAIDVIFLDLGLPVMDGYQFLENLKASKPTKMPKVIILSAIQNDAAIMKALDLGASFYLQKPYSQKKIFHALFSVLALKIQCANSQGNTLADLGLQNDVVEISLSHELAGEDASVVATKAIEFASHFPFVLNQFLVDCRDVSPEAVLWNRLGKISGPDRSIKHENICIVSKNITQLRNAIETSGIGVHTAENRNDGLRLLNRNYLQLKKHPLPLFMINENVRYFQNLFASDGTLIAGRYGTVDKEAFRNYKEQGGKKCYQVQNIY